MNFDKKNNAYKTIMLIIVTAVITFLITAFGLYKYYTNTDKGIIDTLTKSIEISDSTTELEYKIEILNKYLGENYYKDISDEDKLKLIDSALKGYVEGLGDDYTEYLTKDEYEELMINITRKLCRNRYLYVSI